MKFSKRTILITGGTIGIGFELARQLLERGNTVLITGRDQAKLEKTKLQLPGVHTFRSDVSKPDEVEALRKQVIAAFPACDTLFNNAGIMRNLNVNQPGALNDVTREVDINLSGPIHMVQEFQQSQQCFDR